MQAIVRDDIIALKTFVALKFEFEKYAEMLEEAGGYCFIDQYIQHFGGNNKGRYLAQRLEDNGVISTKFFNNYKYCYLTDAAIKYLTYKDDPRDFSKIKKANIPIKKITPNPSEKVLFSSALKFGLMQKYNWIGKKPFINSITKTFNLLYSNRFDNDIKVLESIKKTINYYDKSKIIFIISPYKKILQMLILDSGFDKSSNDYIIILKNYINIVSVDFKEIVIIIASTSIDEANKIKNGLIVKINNRNEMESKLREQFPITENSDSMKDWSLTEFNKTQLEKGLKKINCNLPKFKISIINELFYMEHYKDRVGGKINYIKPKDQERFAALKKSIINNQE